MNNSNLDIDAGSFDDRLAHGFGRVIPYLREHDATQHRGAILHACGHNLAFDLQCENTREVYLYDVLQATGEIEFYVPQVLEMLRSDDKEFSTSQLYGLTMLLAKAGFDDARSALYQQLEQDLASGSLNGCEAVIDLDGIEGYLFVAHKLVDHPIEIDEDYAFREYWLLDHAMERDGIKRVRQAIAEASDNDPVLAAYLDRVETDRQEWMKRIRKSPKLPTVHYDELRGRIDDSAVSTERSAWWQQGKGATQYALDRLAAELANETNADKQIKILHLFFRNRSFNADVAPLLDLVQSANVEIKRAAVRILSEIKEERVRRLAIDLLESLTDVKTGLSLLRYSGLADDFPLVLSILKEDHSDDEFHSMGIDIRWFIEGNPSPDALPILEELYDRGRCTMCRCSTLERMVDCEAVSDWVLEECLFDAYTGTRELASKELAARSR